MMNLFKTFALTWWQTGLFKLGMLALGIVIGAFWHDVFSQYYAVLLIIAAISLSYVTYVWFRQQLG
ncbi:MAG TPA: hypothetical protein VEH07_07430 [Alphaproteobacteria bacterium]|nr:hypothetical protein [Alphaproteobacteria bacterium]